MFVEKGITNISIGGRTNVGDWHLKQIDEYFGPPQEITVLGASITANNIRYSVQAHLTDDGELETMLVPAAWHDGDRWHDGQPPKDFLAKLFDELV